MPDSNNPSSEVPVVTDNDVIDFVTRVLFSDTSKEFSLTDDILSMSKLKYTPQDEDRIWKLLLNTRMVEQSIGFGKAGKIQLSTEGMLIMNKFGSYNDYFNQQTMSSPSAPDNLNHPSNKTLKNKNKNNSASDKK